MVQFNKIERFAERVGSMFFDKISSIYTIELQGEYSVLGVALSILVACIASYTALSLNDRVQQNSFFHPNFWVIFASLASGIGIWSAHFIGMSAFTLPVSMEYNWKITLLSLIPGLFASYFAFYFANKPRKSSWVYFIAGIFMGIAIISVHYIGMLAMKMDVMYVYDIRLVVTSVIVAILLSHVALLVFTSLHKFTRNRITKGFTSTLIGIAIATTHYVGMAAMSFYGPEGMQYDVHSDHSFHTPFLMISVTFFFGVLIGIILISGMMDRYASFRLNNYDSLTMLPNRRNFETHVEKAVTGQTLAVWYLHNIRSVNQEHGFLFGDQVIQHLSEVFGKIKPTNALLFRFEQNKFAFLIKAPEGTKVLYEAMQKIAQILHEPIFINGKQIRLSAVCAVSTIEDYKRVRVNLDNILAVFNDSSITYENEIISYNPEKHTYTFERELSEDVDKAMKQGDLYLVYQPKINWSTHRVVGMEALLRWKHPKYGSLSPAKFVPILENQSKMLRVTDWVIEQVCVQLKEWKAKNFVVGRVGINIPGPYVTSPALLEQLLKTIQKYNIAPSELELEITETSFVEKIEDAMRAVSVFRSHGFSVALDDFGTGVSSLSYLRQMQISTLKIDKTFLKDVPQSSKDSSIIQAIITLGTSLGLDIVFEGVETKEQVEFLKKSCKNAILQGFYFAKPMQVEEVERWKEAFEESLQFA